MKAILLLFLIYINYVICINQRWNPKKAYPKKVNPELNRNLHIRRFIINKQADTTTTTKRTVNSKDYTVFPFTGTNKLMLNVPDSPYFPFEDNLHYKKELFQTGFRKKRSLDAQDGNVRRKRAIKKIVAKGKKTQQKNARRSGKARQNPKARQRTPAKAKRVARAGNKGGSKGSVRKQVKKVISRRLIAARDATIEEYPYTVSIQKGRDHWCSGALLNQRLVITTANCVWKGSRMSRLKVRVGTRHVDRGGQTAKIQEVMRHPRWDIRSYPDNDVALLLLDKRIRFSHSVHGVDLPNRIMLPPFNDVWVTSFGANRRDGLYPENDMTLQVYHSQLMDRSKCNNVTSRFGISVTENFFCLAQSGRRAPCTRDTGAPAVSDGVVWGLASWGIRKLCGTERFPAVYSYLASQSNMDFLANATRLLMSEERYYPFLDRFPALTINRSLSTPPDQYYTGQH